MKSTLFGLFLFALTSVAQAQTQDCTRLNGEYVRQDGIVLRLEYVPSMKRFVRTYINDDFENPYVFTIDGQKKVGKKGAYLPLTYTGSCQNGVVLLNEDFGEWYLNSTFTKIGANLSVNEETKYHKPQNVPSSESGEGEGNTVYRPK